MWNKTVSLLKNIDQFVERYCASCSRLGSKTFIMFSTSFLVGLGLIAITTLVVRRQKEVVLVINNHLEQIDKVLSTIDEQCQILTVRSGGGYIDFLTVKSFQGSMVGCINLVHPEHWQGPYLEQNPTLHGAPYQLVQAKDGVFIVPGNDVLLPNGFSMGHDVLTKPGIALEPHLKEGGKLWHKGRPLARRVSCHIGDWTLLAPGQRSTPKASVGEMLEELSTAPFAQLQIERNL